MLDLDWNDLTTVATYHGTDKAPSLGHHGYTPIYERWLLPRRASIRELLEIGIGTPEDMGRPGYRIGASLRMWRDWLPNCRVTGIDVKQECIFAEDRIETYFCDGADPKQIARLCPGRKWDVIVDDGAHLAEYQIASLKALWPRLNPGGLYFIEDVWQRSVYAILQAWLDLPNYKRDFTVHYVNGQQYGYAMHDSDTLIVLEK